MRFHRAGELGHTNSILKAVTFTSEFVQLHKKEDETSFAGIRCNLYPHPPITSFIDIFPFTWLYFFAVSFYSLLCLLPSCTLVFLSFFLTPFVANLYYLFLLIPFLNFRFSFLISKFSEFMLFCPRYLHSFFPFLHSSLLPHIYFFTLPPLFAPCTRHL